MQEGREARGPLIFRFPKVFHFHPIFALIIWIFLLQVASVCMRQSFSQCSAEHCPLLFLPFCLPLLLLLCLFSLIAFPSTEWDFEALPQEEQRKKWKKREEGGMKPNQKAQGNREWQVKWSYEWIMQHQNVKIPNMKWNRRIEYFDWNYSKMQQKIMADENLMKFYCWLSLLVF